MPVNSATTPAPSADNLIWIDLEMTGLDTTSDHIIEIATVVTDSNLNEISEGPVLAIHQPDDILAAMDEWNTRHHGASGLTDRVRKSRVTLLQAERETLDFLAAHVTERGSPMCGNSICQDRRFLARQMPMLEAFFHYRNLDVSTLKILAERWAPQIGGGFTKDSSHRALSDIRDSIAELAYYRQHLLSVEAVMSER